MIGSDDDWQGHHDNKTTSTTVRRDSFLSEDHHEEEALTSGMMLVASPVVQDHEDEHEEEDERGRGREDEYESEHEHDEREQHEQEQEHEDEQEVLLEDEADLLASQQQLARICLERLSARDAVMELDAVDNIKQSMIDENNTPGEIVKLLVQSYSGYAQMTHIVRYDHYIISSCHHTPS